MLSKTSIDRKSCFHNLWQSLMQARPHLTNSKRIFLISFFWKVNLLHWHNLVMVVCARSPVLHPPTNGRLHHAPASFIINRLSNCPNFDSLLEFWMTGSNVWNEILNWKFQNEYWIEYFNWIDIQTKISQFKIWRNDDQIFFFSPLTSENASC